MDEHKKQESQKTVVAFVAGLLIGGLLVWVFSSSPEAAVPTDERTTEDSTETVEMDESDAAPVEQPSARDEVSSDAGIGDDSTSASPVVDGFAFSVEDQPAGGVVSLGDSPVYPTAAGWVVVHEDADGELGNALGAARYNTAGNLTPNQVTLLRGTSAGATYHVVWYVDDGDRIFDMERDTLVTTSAGGAVRATFIAQ